MAKAIVFGLAAILVAAPALAHEEKPHGKGAHAEHPGHGAEVGEPGDPKQVVRTFQISMGDDMKFRPAVLTVRQGETIKLVVKNAGKLKHELVIGTQAELEAHAKEMEKNPDMEHDDPNAAHVDPGKTGTLVWRFTKRGEVPFACLIPGHMQGGMVGKVIVNP
jgi:uncharacterized cupredoxin-like copper-binding protein